MGTKIEKPSAFHNVEGWTAIYVSDANIVIICGKASPPSIVALGEG